MPAPYNAWESALNLLVAYGGYKGKCKKFASSKNRRHLNRKLKKPGRAMHILRPGRIKFAKFQEKFGKFKQNAGDYSCISIHFCAILTALVAAPTRIWSALHHRWRMFLR